MALISFITGFPSASQSCNAGERLVCVAYNRSGSTSFDVTPDAGGAVWTHAPGSPWATLPGDDTARRSLAVMELVPTTDVVDETFTAAWDSGGTDCIWMRMEEGPEYQIAAGQTTADDSGTGTVGSQGTGSTATAPAGNVLAIAAAAIRSGGSAPVEWSTTAVDPPLTGGGNALLDDYDGKGVGGNAGAAGYLSLTGQSSQAWSDTVSLPVGDDPRMITAALAVWVEQTGTAVPLGAATEADAANALAVRKAATLAMAAEADAARPMGAAKQTTLGQAGEADTARPVTAVKQVKLGVAREVDSPQAVAAVKQAGLGTATEQDVARPLVVPGAPLQLGAARTVDAARPMTVALIRHLGSARSADAARPLVVRKVASLGPVREVDRALALAGPPAGATTIPPPNTGTTAQPDTGTILRPSTGAITRPTTTWPP